MKKKYLKTKEIIKILNEICPEELQAEWDNSGLQLGFSDKPLESVLISLDIDENVIDEAISLKADMIITHHPLIFNPIKMISDDDPISRLLMLLLKNEISVYSLHTNFDVLTGGNNDYLAKLLDIDDFDVLKESENFARIGRLKKPKSLLELTNEIAKRLKIPREKMRIVKGKNAEISKVAWCTGAGADFIDSARESGADLFITGDVKYHDALNARIKGISVIDVGHYYSEEIFCENMKEMLNKKLNLIGSKGIGAHDSEDLILPTIHISKEFKDPFYSIEDLIGDERYD